MKSHDAWNFVDDVIQSLARKVKVLEDRIQIFSDQMDEMRRRNEKDIIKIIKNELLNNECETLDVEFYQNYDLDVGFVLAITEKVKWVTEFNAFDNHHEADIKIIASCRSVELREFEGSKSRLGCFLTKLNKQELIELVERCKSHEDQTLKNLSCWTFASNTIEYLLNKGKIVEGEKKKRLRKIDKLKN